MRFLKVPQRPGLLNFRYFRGALLAVLACTVGLSQASDAVAEEATVIPLTAIDSYAPTALWTLVFLEYFIPEVDRRLAATGNYRSNDVDNDVKAYLTGTNDDSFH